MASGGDEDDAVLSDLESDESVPATVKDSLEEKVSPERFKEVLAELDREKQARQAVETSKSELQVQFNRLKALTHEAIKKRDEAGRQRDDALREKESVSKELEESNRRREEMGKQLDESVRANDSSRSEIDNSIHMLVSGMEKISGKISTYKNFSNGGLPKSKKYSGLAAVAYGVIKRTNEIVEELVKQIDATAKSRNEAREQMDQRNYEIAIEVSQLEASISGLKEEVEKKSSLVQDLEKKIADTESAMSEKLSSRESEALELKQLIEEYEDKMGKLESKFNSQRPLLIDHLNLVSRIHERIYELFKIFDGDGLDQSELSESLFMPQEMEIEENIRASLAGMESIHELIKVVVEKARDLVESKNNEMKNLNETVSLLVKEKEQIGTLLRSALSTKMTKDPSSKTGDLFQTAETGLRDAGIDFEFSKFLGNGEVQASRGKGVGLGAEDEIYTLAGTLENIVKASQLEIIELQHSVEELRAECNLLKQHVEAQAKELNHRIRQVEELEEKERVANESVEGLMMDIVAAEEEIARWKGAAEQEAAAGRAIEQECMTKLSDLKLELEEAKVGVVEAEKKLKFKEETATAAMAARDAAEKSLRLADMRATRLRDRVEELSHKLEEFETREDMRGNRTRPRYVCWPWQWLGLDIVGGRSADVEQQSSNETELSEPLL